MTTPRDDIDGLSEGLRLWGKRTIPECYPHDLCSEAATQLAALSAENTELKAALDRIVNADNSMAKKLSESIEINAKLSARVKELEEVLADKQRLAREIDVAMHGEEDAAKQASLCDLVVPARQLRARVKDLEKECFRLASDTCHAGYGDEYGHHRCREVDEAEARALRAEQESKQYHDYWREELSRANRLQQERDDARERVELLEGELESWKSQPPWPL